MNKKQIKIMRDLQNVIEQTDVTAVILTTPGSDRIALHTEYPVGDMNMIVTVMFLPPFVPKAESTMDCMIQILIADDIPDETYPALKQGISVLDYFVARGGFIMSPDCKKLMYRNTVNFIANQKNEDIIKKIMYHIASGLSITELWADPIFDVIEGKMDFESFARYIDSYVTEQEQE